MITHITGGHENRYQFACGHVLTAAEYKKLQGLIRNFRRQVISMEEAVRIFADEFKITHEEAKSIIEEARQEESSNDTQRVFVGAYSFASFEVANAFIADGGNTIEVPPNWDIAPDTGLYERVGEFTVRVERTYPPEVITDQRYDNEIAAIAAFKETPIQKAEQITIYKDNKKVAWRCVPLD